MKFKSLTMRIWLIFSAVLLIFTAGITTLYHFAVRRVERINRLNDLTAVHESLIKTEKADVSYLDGLQNLREISHFKIQNGRITDLGRQFAPDGASRQAIHNRLAEFAKGELHSARTYFTLGGIEVLAVVSSLEDGYFVSYMPHFRNDAVLRALLILAALFMVAGFFVARITAAYLAKPLSQLEGFTQRIAAKQWGEPITVKSRDEIGRLAQSMNKMQEQLKRTDEEERLFLQSISHDLKTPVMVIMSHADAIIDGVYIDTPENTAKIIKDEAISLSKKIKNLLYFNTLDYSLDNGGDETLFLDDIVRATFNRLKHTRNDVSAQIELERTPITADRDKLTVAVENIADNALRYSDGTIRVTLKNRVLEIYNSGKNIPTENLSRIFDHMYRDKTGNFGLGLAISHKIFTHYGGKIEAVNREDGVSFIIDFS